MTPVEDADRFSRYLEELLWDVDDAEHVDVERIGLGALRVTLMSGTAVILSVEADQ